MKKAISVLLAFGFVLQLGLFSAFAAPKVAVASVKVTPISIKWAVGNAGTIKATVAPTNATTKTVIWKSSNPAVVSVDSTGKVKALALGTATITCTAKDGSGKKATCAATVIAPKTIQEIVTFYNNSANATKAYKGKVTVDRTDGTTSTVKALSPDIQKLRDMANEMLPNDYPKHANKTFVNGMSGTDSLQKFLPRGDFKTLSDLQAAGVKSATCTKSGTGWKVVIVLKQESVNDLNAKPKYHYQCMDTVDISNDDLKPFSLGGAVAVGYLGASINAQINNKGLLNKLALYEPDSIAGTLKWSVFNLIKTTVAGTWRSETTYKY